MRKIKRVFESENIRVGFDEFMDNHERIVVASKDRDFMNGDKWVINHLSVDEACELRDSLDEVIERMEE